MFERVVKTPKELSIAIWDLVEENLELFDERKGAIDPLESKVVYRREPVGQNEYLNARDMIRLGYGDCEDLAAWLIAYYIWCGVEARPVLLPQTKTFYHVICEAFYEGEWVKIDPSKIRGM